MEGISIIIPSYKPGKYLIDAVESILNQPIFNAFEVIVIDDGSPDKETHFSLRKIIKKESVIIIKNKNNLGTQFARNQGLRAAKFNYIMMLDADDCLNTDNAVLKYGTYIDNSIDILNQKQDVAFVHCTTKMFGDYHGYTTSAFRLTEELILKKYHAPNCIIYRKEDAFESGLYDESITKWQDWSFAIGILNARKKKDKKNIIEFLNLPYYLYRIHQKTERISSKQVSELEMIKKTFIRHPEIFRFYYGNLTDDEIIHAVYMNKPTDLTNLLHIAANDIDIAFEMVKMKKYQLITGINLDNIP